MKGFFISLIVIGALMMGPVLGQTMNGAQKEDAARAESLWSPATLPAHVQDIVSNYSNQCRQLGGTLSVESQSPAIMTADLDADGIQDYVLNPQNLRCSAAATAFCGNGGCDIKIAVSGDAYTHPVSVLGGQPTISLSPEGAIVEIWVNRADCNISDRSQACWARYSWKDGKASIVYRARPLQE